MINTTQSFYDNSIRAYRSTQSKVTCFIQDVDINNDISSLVVSDNTFFYQSKLIDGDDSIIPTYGTCEQNQFFLDGNTVLLPQTLTGNENICWWSDMLPSAYEQQFYTFTPKITITFNNHHSSVGITLGCQKASWQMNCKWYDGATLLESQTISDGVSKNKGYIIFDKEVENYDKIEITFYPYTLTSESNQELFRVKITEIVFGTIQTYDADDLSDASVTESTSIMSNQLVPNELNFSVFNYDNYYNVFGSNLFKWFKVGQKILAKSSVLNVESNEYEWIPMGTYYVGETNVGEMLTVKAYGILNTLNQQTFYSDFYTNITVEELVGDILGSYPYYVHPNCANIQLSGYIPVGTKKDALKYVAIASNSVVKEGRDGVIYIYQATEDLSHNQIVADDTVYTGGGLSGLMVANVQPMPLYYAPQEDVLIVDKDTMMSSLSTSQIGVYSQCDVTYINYTLGNELKELYNDTLTTDANGYAFIDYNKPVSVSSATGGGVFTHYADCSVMIGTPNTEYNVVVSGYLYEMTKNIASASIEVSNFYEDIKETMELTSCNTLITNSTRALSCAKWYLDQLQKRIDATFGWWSVATVESSDYIKVETESGDIKKMQINEIEYNLLTLSSVVKGVI